MIASARARALTLVSSWARTIRCQDRLSFSSNQHDEKCVHINRTSMHTTLDNTFHGHVMLMHMQPMPHAIGNWDGIIGNWQFVTINSHTESEKERMRKKETNQLKNE